MIFDGGSAAGLAVVPASVLGSQHVVHGGQRENLRETVGVGNVLVAVTAVPERGRPRTEARADVKRRVGRHAHRYGQAVVDHGFRHPTTAARCIELRRLEGDAWKHAEITHQVGVMRRGAHARRKGWMAFGRENLRKRRKTEPHGDVLMRLVRGW